MLFRRIKSEGIAHNSYFVGSGNEAAVIDPRRDCQRYLNLGLQNGMVIRHIFETHRNEDYVIGSTELRAVTGANIYHGPGQPWKYGTSFSDGESIAIGSLQITGLHTPGHTDESMSFVLTDLSSGPNPVIVFTGDTLFVDDTGRIDLYGPAEASRLAGLLYDSVFGKLLPLGDGTIICPAHSSGSVCGTSIGERDQSTIGIERQQNVAVRRTTRNEFLAYKAGEKIERPPYFLRMEKLNLEGPPILGSIPKPPPLKAERFAELSGEDSIVLDVRSPVAFGGAHIKGSYAIWLEGIPEFAGWVLPYDRPIILILDRDSDLERAVITLIRLGYDRIDGYLKDSILSWYGSGLPIETLPLLSVHQLKDMLDGATPPLLLDVRTEDEWGSGHLQGALHIYVGHIEERLAEVPRDRPVAVYCNIGNRASLAASILLRNGYSRVFNVLGSYQAWIKARYPIVRD